MSFVKLYFFYYLLMRQGLFKIDFIVNLLSFNDFLCENYTLIISLNFNCYAPSSHITILFIFYNTKKRNFFSPPYHIDKLFYVFVAKIYDGECIH